jgi:transcriptional regulator with XRE-family HTH domain
MVFMDKKNIAGKKIKEIREQKNLTQEQLTARLNIYGIKIDRPMITRIENQTRYLLDYELYAIAKVLNVSIEELSPEEVNILD